MIKEPELQKVVRGILPKPLAPVATVKLDDTSVKHLKHLRVVTDAWKTLPRSERIGRVIKGLHNSIPLKDRKHIISVAVFTGNEWKERQAFARQLSRISGRKTNGRKPRGAVRARHSKSA